MDTSGNQEPQQNQLTEDIEVTPPKAIKDIDLAIKPNKKSTTPEDTPNTNIVINTNNKTHQDTLETPQPLESPGKQETSTKTIHLNHSKHSQPHRTLVNPNTTSQECADPQE